MAHYTFIFICMSPDPAIFIFKSLDTTNFVYWSQRTTIPMHVFHNTFILICKSPDIITLGYCTRVPFVDPSPLEPSFLYACPQTPSFYIMLFMPVPRHNNFYIWVPRHNPLYMHVPQNYHLSIILYMRVPRHYHFYIWIPTTLSFICRSPPALSHLYNFVYASPTSP